MINKTEQKVNITEWIDKHESEGEGGERERKRGQIERVRQKGGETLASRILLHIMIMFSQI